MEKQNSPISDFIEKYRFWIGSGLLLLIIISSFILLLRENRWKPAYESRLEKLELKISNLDQKIDQVGTDYQVGVSDILAQSQSIQESPTTFSGSKTSGKVAGTSTASKTNTTVSQSTNLPAQPTIVNINTATLGQLDSLPGIGPVYAQRIIDYRETKGNFKTIDEIKNVKGIGDSTFEKMKDRITVN